VLGADGLDLGRRGRRVRGGGRGPVPVPDRRVGCQYSVTASYLGFYATRSYSLSRPPRIGRRLIRSRVRSTGGRSDRGGCRSSARWVLGSRNPLPWLTWGGVLLRSEARHDRERVAAPALPRLLPHRWLVDLARSNSHEFGSGDPCPASRERGPASWQPKTEAGLGRSSLAHRVDPAPATGAADTTAGHPNHGPGVASSAARQALDVPEPAGPPATEPSVAALIERTSRVEAHVRRCDGVMAPHRR
jgi:hypothetical protein